MTSVGSILVTNKDGGGNYPVWVVFDGHEDTLLWDEQAIPGDDPDEIAGILRPGRIPGRLWGRGASWRGHRRAAPNTAVQLLHGGRIRTPREGRAVRVRRELRRKGGLGPGISAAEVDNSLVIGEKTYNELVVNLTSEVYKSTTWMFDLCDQSAEAAPTRWSS